MMMILQKSILQKKKLVLVSASNYIKDEVFDLRKNKKNNVKQIEGQNEEQKKEQRVRSLVIHPIFYPNDGLEKEIYMAEEAVGLAKSLQWHVKQGPFNRITEPKEIYDIKNTKPKNLKEKLEQIRQQRLIEQKYQEEQEEEEETNDDKVENDVIRDGDYVYVANFKGTYDESLESVKLDLTETEDEELKSIQWTDKYIRNQLALSGTLKIRDKKSKTMLANHKLHLIGECIRENDINAVFINTSLTSIQTKNLEKIFTGIANNKPMNQIFKRNNPLKNSDYETEMQTQTDLEYLTDQDSQQSGQQNVQQAEEKRVKVFDRFTIILQIFGKRMQSKNSKLQVELAYLNFIKQRLQKGGSSYSVYYNIFKGDLMMAREIRYDIVSARQRNIKGALSGEGESQLELQKRLIEEKIKKVKTEIQKEDKNRQLIQKKKKQMIKSKSQGVVSIVGYTNSGKSQLMNTLMKKDIVKSQDMLFQTLQTTQKQLYLPSGQKCICLDTIGFISELPHELFHSFKSCLEEIYNSDVIIHLIDVSNPFWRDQQKTVNQVLQNMQIDQNLQNSNFITVYNKVDLLEKEEIRKMKKENENGIFISALNGVNVPKLLQEIDDKMNQSMDKKYYTITNPLDKHNERVKWLNQVVSINHLVDPVYDYTSSRDYPSGKVQFKVLLDDITYRRYQMQFGIIERDKNKGLPPKEWLQRK